MWTGRLRRMGFQGQIEVQNSVFIAGGNVEVVAIKKAKILRNLAGYLPIALAAGMIYFVLGLRA
jgi:hypothetical protein